jgi:stage V sporulation protein K
MLEEDWKEYLDSIPDAMRDIWAFVHYEKFCNTEIIKLQRRVRFLQQDLDEEVAKNDELKTDLIQARKKSKPKTRKRKFSEIKTTHHDESCDDSLWLKRETKRPKHYKTLSNERITTELKKVFSNLQSIKDITNLKEHPNRFDFIENNLKFKKLYKLIPCLEKMNEIIGMDSVKKEVFKYISYFIHGLNDSKELNHIVITGPPGVGKTTLAKIVGKIYLNLGFLNSNNFTIARRSDLIGKYCGHTAKQTQEMIDKAEGGVLFIDEVYSLGNKEQKDSFTKECIDTINQALTENSSKFLCIIAGYEKEVEECFFAYNQGLERRFPIRFKIESYDSVELFAILQQFVDVNGWVMDPTFTKSIIEKNVKQFKFFGADMQSVFQKAKEAYSLRLMKETIILSNVTEKKLLTCEDLENGVNFILEQRQLVSSKETPPYPYMYM